MCQRRELIAPYCKIISKSVCCWSFRVFFFFFACCRQVQVVVGCVLLVAGRFRLFFACFRLFPGSFLFVTGLFRSFQVVSCPLQVVVGPFRSFLVRCRSFQVISGRFRSFLVLVSTNSSIQTGWIYFNSFFSIN